MTPPSTRSAPATHPATEPATQPATYPAVEAMPATQPAVAVAVPPMYWRVLRLSAVRPNGWQRAVLVEGVIGVSIVLALADVASAWAIVVLPLVAMGIVKVHDYLAGLLDPARQSAPPPARLADYAVFAGIPLGILGAALEVRRQQPQAAGGPGSPSYGP